MTRKPHFILAILLAVGLNLNALGETTMTKRMELAEQFHQRSIEESLTPVRPGEPGIQPFWNAKARRFIYAPAFDFAPIEGANTYRFTATCGEKNISFEADAPWTNLSPIWKDLPVGQVDLIVEGLDAAGGKVLGEAGKRTFHKDAPFKGFYRDPIQDYEASAILALKTIFERPYVRCWLTRDEPDMSYYLNGYPSKMIGALLTGAAIYVQIKPRPGDADQVMDIARHAGHWLIKHANPADSPLAYFTPTYYNVVEGSGQWNHQSNKRNMLIYPAVAARGLLDFYDATGEKEFLEAALHIADTYKARQLPEGTWHLFVENDTGKPVNDNLMVPDDVLPFLDRLVRDYGKTEYAQTVKNAEKYMQQSSMKTFNWHGQFEDVLPMPPYEDMTMVAAANYATYLLRNAGENPENIKGALELVHYVEDQFVFWELPQWAPQHWFTPGVGEQYLCYTPISATSAIMTNLLCQAWAITKDPIYLAKARELANTNLFAQAWFSNGDYPTWVNLKGDPDWINCTVETAQVILKHAEIFRLMENPEKLVRKK